MVKHEYFPGWLPVDTCPWRLVSTRDGTFYKDKTGSSLRFVTDQAALVYASRNKIPLAAGVDKAAKLG